MISKEERKIDFERVLYLYCTLKYLKSKLQKMHYVFQKLNKNLRDIIYNTIIIYNGDFFNAKNRRFFAIFPDIAKLYMINI